MHLITIDLRNFSGVPQACGISLETTLTRGDGRRLPERFTTLKASQQPVVGRPAAALLLPRRSSGRSANGACGVASAQPVRVALAAALHLDAPKVACRADDTLNPKT